MDIFIPNRGKTKSRFGHQDYYKNNSFMIDLSCSTGHKTANYKDEQNGFHQKTGCEPKVFASFPLIVFFYLFFFNLLFFR